MPVADLYLLGAPKCGTTTVAGWLSGHSQIYWSVPKEPYYWASDFPRQRAHYGFATREAYESLYVSPAARRARYRGDGSTTYLYSDVAVREIRAAVADPRFVVCLRNPVDLVVSYHRTQLTALNDDEPDLASAWRRSLDGRLPATDPLDPKLVDYQRMGRLGAAMQRLYAELPRERVHVILLDDLRRDPEATWRALAADLEVDADPMPEFDARNASNKAHRLPALHRLTHRPPRALEPPVRRLRQWVRTTDVGAVRALKERLWRAENRPALSPAMRTELIDYFRSDVDLLSGLIGRDLTAWKTGVPVT